MDRTTEIIAHLIGIFHVTLEEERQRDIYDAFQRMRPEEPAINLLEATPFTLRADYKLGEFTGKLRYVPPSDVPPGPLTSTFDVAFPIDTWPVFGAPIAAVAALDLIPPVRDVLDVQDVPHETVSLVPPALVLPEIDPPGSTATVVYQRNFLNDDDIVLLGPMPANVIPFKVLAAELAVGQAITTAIASPFHATLPQLGDDTGAQSIVLHQQIKAARPVEMTGVTATIRDSQDAYSLHLDGIAVREVPTLQEVMPLFLREREETAAQKAADKAEAESLDALRHLDRNDAFDDIPDAPGLTVTSGGNTLLNEARINSSWLDAPVFIVMGDAIALDVIIQINAIFDHDSGGFDSPLQSQAFNTAVMEVAATGSPMSGGGAGSDALPAHWLVTRIEGDLVNLNQVSQYNFQTDHDLASVTYAQGSLFLGMGENGLVNVFGINELGYGYDLIVVGGDLIQINWIHQTNLLIDNDTLTYSGLTPLGLSGGDNLAWNSAAITRAGVDSHVDLDAGFADAGRALADGATSLVGQGARDAVFEGHELLRVLYVEGDLVDINWIEQTNVLGDSDQIHLAANAMIGAADGAYVTAPMSR